MRVESSGSVATVTLCRPAVRNAQTPAMWAALAEIGASLGPEIRVAVLRGEGESFSAGLDLAMFGDTGTPGDLSFAELLTMDDIGLDETISTFQEAFSWWRRPSLISIAAVQGHAVGAGFQLALACDLRVLADNARLSMRETTLGLVPDLGGTQPLVEAVGYSRALELCITGRFVAAEEAAATSGWRPSSSRPTSWPPPRTTSSQRSVPRRPAAVSATKALLRGALRRGYDEQLAAERTAQVGRIRGQLAAVPLLSPDPSPDRARIQPGSWLRPARPGPRSPRSTGPRRRPAGSARGRGGAPRPHPRRA